MRLSLWGISVVWFGAADGARESEAETPGSGLTGRHRARSSLLESWAFGLRRVCKLVRRDKVPFQQQKALQSHASLDEDLAHYGLPRDRLN